MTKIACISDIHSNWRKIEIPECDLLLIAGDIDTFGSIKGFDLEKLKDFNDWCADLMDAGIVKVDCVAIAGNHDVLAQKKPDLWRRVLSDITYLQDETIELCGLKIYGTPWSPFFHDWAFNAHRGDEIQRIWKKIPDDTDVLIVHGPPHGCCDNLFSGEKIGCEDLRARIEQLNIKLVVCGHIHLGYGQDKIGNTIVVNAAQAGSHHTIKNKPIVIDL